LTQVSGGDGVLLNPTRRDKVTLSSRVDEDSGREVVEGAVENQKLLMKVARRGGTKVDDG
jgi:hypothetical protein